MNIAKHTHSNSQKATSLLFVTGVILSVCQRNNFFPLWLRKVSSIETLNGTILNGANGWWSGAWRAERREKKKASEKYSAIQWHIGYLLWIKPETMNWESGALSEAHTHTYKTDTVGIGFHFKDLSLPLSTRHDSNGRKKNLHYTDILRQYRKRKAIYVTILIGCHTKCFNVVFYVVYILRLSPSFHIANTTTSKFTMQLCLPIVVSPGDCTLRVRSVRCTFILFFFCVLLLFGMWRNYCWDLFCAVLHSVSTPPPPPELSTHLAFILVSFAEPLITVNTCNHYVPYAHTILSVYMNFIKIYFGNFVVLVFYCAQCCLCHYVCKRWGFLAIVYLPNLVEYQRSSSYSNCKCMCH